MISFDGFIMEDGVPIYQQILLYLKRGIIAGTIVSGDELPSRRVLSALLGVNPNTVQKAYRLLEEEGLIHSRSGAKSCVAADEAAIRRLRGEILGLSLKTVIDAMKQMGMTLEDAQAALADHWEVQP